MNINTRLILKTTAGIAAVLLIGPACSSDQAPAAATPTAATPAVAASGQALNITFKTLPDPPQSGDNTVEVALKQPDGKPVTDATVSAEFRMPAMPSMNMPEMRSAVALTHQGEGKYRGAGQLAMSGTWNVTVTVLQGGQPIGNQRYTVIAK